MPEFLQAGILVAIIAHGLIGISLVWDKVLLRQPQTQGLVSFTFWLGAISIFGLLLMPFGYHTPPLPVAGIAFLAGFLDLVSSGFYYAVLKRGEASETLAVLGGFSPTATALFAIPFLTEPVGGQTLGFALMTAGGFLMFFSERLNVRRVLPLIVLTAALFGLANVLQKLALDRTDFVTAYVLFSLGTVSASLLLLIRKSWRVEIFKGSANGSGRPGELAGSARFWYFVNRFLSGVGSLGIFYAIKLSNPAIVDAISGVRYIVIFLGAYLLTRIHSDWLSEEFEGRSLFWKTAATMVVVAGLVYVGLGEQKNGAARGI
jgi:uncharacterized membrane protein